MLFRYGTDSSEWTLLRLRSMQVLEARFHPWRKARGPFLVVARVVCRLRRAIVEPTLIGREEQSPAPQETMLHMLEYLVDSNSPDAFHRLRQLRSDFWSFVEIRDGADE